MPSKRKTGRTLASVGAALVAATLAGCGDEDDTLPQLQAAQAAGLIGTCDVLPAKLAALPDTTVAAVITVAAGLVGNVQAPEHCLVTGEMFRRTSAVDGKSYAIGFENAPAERLERPLLLPGQRRHRRLGECRSRSPRRRTDHRRARAGLRGAEFGRRPQQRGGRRPGIRHRPAGAAGLPATRPKPSCCLRRRKSSARPMARCPTAATTAAVRTAGATRWWPPRAMATSTTAS